MDLECCSWTPLPVLAVLIVRSSHSCGFKSSETVQVETFSQRKARLSHGIEREFYHPEKQKHIPCHKRGEVMLHHVLKGLKERAPSCAACVSFVETCGLLLSSGLPWSELSSALANYCAEAGINTEQYCRGYMDNYGPDFRYILEEGPEAGAETFCALLRAGDEECAAWAGMNEWTVEVPGGKPRVEEPALPEPGSPTTKFLQLSDVHVDPTYTVGSWGSSCPEFQCCTNSTASAEAPSEEEGAGFWGGYRCGVPPWTFGDMLRRVAEEHPDLDFVLLTGDFPSHDIDRQGRDFNLGVSNFVFDSIEEVFPGVPVFPSLGNHEIFPVSSYPTAPTDEEHDVSWLYDALADQYSRWIPPSDLSRFRESGFYSTEIQRGLRAVAINSNMCNTDNPWIVYNWVDPLGQLELLMEALLDAEEAEDKVFLLSHVPTNYNGCLPAWGRAFTQIVDRFESTLVNAFFGHRHHDQFFVAYDVDTRSRPTLASFIAPSANTWTDVNPSYRVFTADGDYAGSTRRVLDFDTYYMDLEEANEAGPAFRPQWRLEYNALIGLEMDSLLPSAWDDLARRLAADDDLWDRFYGYYNSEVSFAGQASNSERDDILCALVTSDPTDLAPCDRLL